MEGHGRLLLPLIHISYILQTFPRYILSTLIHPPSPSKEHEQIRQVSWTFVNHSFRNLNYRLPTFRELNSRMCSQLSELPTKAVLEYHRIYIGPGRQYLLSIPLASNILSSKWVGDSHQAHLQIGCSERRQCIPQQKKRGGL